MQLILLENIINLGKIGDTVKVKNGNGRNFLLRQGKALRANKENIDLVNKKKDELTKKNNELKKEFINEAKKLNNKKILFKKESKDNGDLYGTIKPKEISNEILEKLNFPVFVKPSNSGSSLGISKVINESEILKALQKAWEIDPRILVEEGLEVREIECGIIGKSKLLTSEIGEVKYESDWYDYDSKYYSNNKITIPAEIDSKISKQIQAIAIQSCRALNIFGFARVDFFLEKSSNKILLNEINTIPGFTKNSMFPMLWKASGLNIEQLVAKLVDISLDL